MASPVNSYSSLAAVRADLLSGRVTCAALVEAYLERIAANTHLNIFLEVFADTARAQAKAVDAKVAAGTAGALAGMVIGLKDNICVNGHKVSASSKILEGFVSPYTSTVAQRLLDADAIIIGRTNCDEFAMGSSNENSAFGTVKNPYDITRVPGGSSGGSAAAVAADLCLATLGTDTGGSIRQPASFCGVVGLKPTYGRVSRWGVIAYASSFDQVGPITKTVDDAAAILEVIAGMDEFDGTLSSQPVETYTQKLEAPKALRIAVLDEGLNSEGLDTEIRATMHTRIEQLRALGHTVETVKFPYLDYLVPAYYVLTTAEASSNLARYDGIRYGYRSPNATDLESTYKKSRSEGFGPEVKRRIMLGTFVLSAGFYDAYYSKGQKVRRLLRDKTNEILAQYDAILLPSTPGAAFQFGANSADPIKMYLEDIFTVQANLTGIPAISVPAGKTAAGLPFGLQLMSANFTESKLLALAKVVEGLG
jgi:aspartyl-tRNA(Asn)/glutamyl-tRNA(Gln) amidotransferase subunit A